MAHGTKPYGRTQSQVTIFGVQDMGELAARLGSIDTHDRRGNVVWLDDFESGVEAWDFSGTGAGNARAWSAERHRSGGFSVYHRCGSTLTMLSEMDRSLALPVINRTGIEFSILFGLWVSQIRLYAHIVSLAQTLVYEVRYTVATDTWEFRNNALGWTALVPTIDLLPEGYCFHTVKLIVDPLALAYSQLIVDDLTYDMSGLPVGVVGGVFTPALFVEIGMTGTAAQIGLSWVDDVIVTQNEP